MKLLIGLVILSLVLVGCGDETAITGGAVAVDTAIGTCEDTDGGVNKDVKGIVSVEDEDHVDSCVAGLLIEYSCDGNKATNQNIRCPDGCKNGKCT